MRYMGGKFHQSKAIVECLRPLITPQSVYVEPFCGAMWSATRVIEDLRPGIVLLNDINNALITLWRECIERGVEWLPTDLAEVERNYQAYKKAQNMEDPLTAWYGAALSFGGKWFGGVARAPDIRANGYLRDKESIRKKVSILQSAHDVRLLCGQYHDMVIPDMSVVYCDPPYEGRTKAHKFDQFDYTKFWGWVRDLSQRCMVFTSCFDCPDDFRAIHEWGDTVVRHHASKGTDGTNEKLVIVR